MQKSSWGISLVWFGAAVSIAEILTGTLLAPLGLARALAAIVIGHVIGGVLLYFAGYIGARWNLSAMECAKRSFGQLGGKFFAILNVIQLVGWTAVMIAAGAEAAQGLLPLPGWAWIAVIGGLILLWISVRAREFKVLNLVAMTLLFLLSVLLSLVVFRSGAGRDATGTLSFGEALELVIAMPLSWLPLIADYTMESARPKLASFIAAGIYSAGSSWMYAIGLGAALYAGGESVTTVMSQAGFGVSALLVVLFSTVTTTYLDVFSSEMSLASITGKIPPWLTGVVVCAVGTLLAIFASTGSFENFLYWIGSVFAPMIAIEIADFFFVKRQITGCWNVPALISWGVGFILYRVLLSCNPAFGSTIPVMALSMALYLVLEQVKNFAYFGKKRIEI